MASFAESTASCPASLRCPAAVRVQFPHNGVSIGTLGGANETPPRLPNRPPGQLAHCPFVKINRSQGHSVSREGSLEEEGPRTKRVCGESHSYVAQVGWEGSIQQNPKRVPSVSARPQGAAAGSPKTVTLHLGPAPRSLHRRLPCLPGRAAKTCSGPWAPSPRWGHLRLLGRTEAAEGGGNWGTFWMRPSMSR